ncbi:HNH endonuclease [Oscillatoria sp. FACHB-1406]|uniref:HNH endonuclease n=1 Tax=Oscillatoria sp. FACHB-1406 TaxID=2692846 RepID=UPI0016831EB7|nr:HNH endonuclease [Oscillatoria sp. FACHB-1406]MBD2576295.1 HNH endonuclease [Oscillatoria sp. FACHB-1406]
MSEVVKKSSLKTLYRASDINRVWQASQNVQAIEHPERGFISPNEYRALYKGKPCPYCGQKMVHSQQLYSTTSKQEAIDRGYEYTDKLAGKVINQAGNTFFHPHYVTLDHKINKARCPEKMFEFSNLEVICWRCNQNKGDNNTFELQHNLDYLNALADEALTRYPLL